MDVMILNVTRTFVNKRPQLRCAIAEGLDLKQPCTEYMITFDMGKRHEWRLFGGRHTMHINSDLPDRRDAVSVWFDESNLIMSPRFGQDILVIFDQKEKNPLMISDMESDLHALMYLAGLYGTPWWKSIHQHPSRPSGEHYVFVSNIQDFVKGIHACIYIDMETKQPSIVFDPCYDITMDNLLRTIEFAKILQGCYSNTYYNTGETENNGGTT